MRKLPVMALLTYSGLNFDFFIKKKKKNLFNKHSNFLSD